MEIQIGRRDFLKVIGLGTVGLGVGRSVAGCIASPGWQPVGAPIVVGDEQTAFEATLRAHREWGHYLAAHSNGNGAGPFFYATPEFGAAPMRARVSGVEIGQDTLRTGVRRGSVIDWEALPGEFVAPRAISLDDFRSLAPGQADAYERIMRRHGAR